MQTHGAQLSYCLNVHPVRSLADLAATLRGPTRAVKAAVCPDRPFGLGAWIPAPAVAELRADPSRLDPLRDLLAAEGYYVFTLNGFPYGTFHGARVKTAVYQPDWADPDRLAYTTALLDLMATLMPDGITGSISTVPVTYGKTLPDAALAALGAVASHARAIHDRTGKHLYLALEPEPDCYLETSAEAIAFCERLYTRFPHAGDYLGLCFDTCHLCLQHEDLSTAFRAILAAGIPIPKVQISAALRYANHDGSAATALAPYDETVYLHQTRVVHHGRETHRYPDLGPALAANPVGDWVVHFHVPLPFTGDGPLTSTADALTPDFLRLAFAHSPNLEIETYTFGVLPEPKPTLVDSISAEFRWLLTRLDA